MLTEAQANRVWQRMVEAEVRSFYFADLASSYNRLKQILNGATFFLSSGAAATVIAKMPAPFRLCWLCWERLRQPIQ